MFGRKFKMPENFIKDQDLDKIKKKIKNELKNEIMHDLYFENIKSFQEGDKIEYDGLIYTFEKNCLDKDFYPYINKIVTHLTIDGQEKKVSTWAFELVEESQRMKVVR